MRKILAAIFGSPKNTETIVDSAVSGLDKLFFTNEEKAEGMAETREWFLRYLEASQPQNLARRLIAICVVFMWMLLILTATFSWLIDRQFAFFVFDVVNNNVNTPFAIIIGFYFAAHIARQIPRKGDN